jgi:hypothetical protein
VLARVSVPSNRYARRGRVRCKRSFLVSAFSVKRGAVSVKALSRNGL